jgi:hypothetical protein
MIRCPHTRSRWVVSALVAWTGGCGIDSSGIGGAREGGALEADGGTGAIDARPSTQLDAPADVGLCVPANCPAPANGDPACAGGRCAFTCRAGFRVAGDRCAASEQPGCCGDACVMCPVPASGTATCTSKQCGFTCNAGYHPSGPQCLANDTAVCCGTGCAACPAVVHGLSRCRNQACDFVCETGYHREGAGCALDDNASCCGADCKKCGAPANATPLCKSGQCAFTCAAGFHTAGDACVANDQLSCCGPACELCQATRANATPICAPTGCASPSPCLATHHDCNGLCVASDAVASCGAACTPCPGRPNAAVSCNGTSCVYACAANRADCDGNPNNGCEADLLTDPLNCGGCAAGPNDSHFCSAGGSQAQTCSNGMCGCPSGWADCNGERNDGCETNLQTSNVHCGACNSRNPKEEDLLTEDAYKAANAAPACRVYKLETCVLGHCTGP